MLPSWGQSGPEVGPKVLPRWGQSGPEVGPKWARSEPGAVAMPLSAAASAAHAALCDHDPRARPRPARCSLLRERDPRGVIGNAALE